MSRITISVAFVTLFSIQVAVLPQAAPPAELTFEIVHGFVGPPAHPAAALIEASDGNFYGTTSDGGTVFKLEPSGELTTLHSFSGGDGRHPAALLEASDGNFYGTTLRGGEFHFFGTVFRLTPSGVLTTLHSFEEGDDGRFPTALLEASDGNFYGTTSGGGEFDSFGTVFKISPSGELTTLHSFSGADGSYPRALIAASDGNFYGTTSEGGEFDRGTVFRIEPSGDFTTLHSFNGTDGDSPGGLVEASDGSLYGTTFEGGAHCTFRCGTVFKLELSGELTTLHSFDDSSSPGRPTSLMEASDGSFYGTTYRGGMGTVFKLERSGELTTFHAFSGADGSRPRAALIEASDGNFYGTTPFGGRDDCPFGCGTVFKLEPTGELTTLHSFDKGAFGGAPRAPLMEGSDGNFYGTTSEGGAFEGGTVFKLEPSGEHTTLHSFSEASHPEAALIEGSDGSFYGTTLGGGEAECNFVGCGTVFKITPSGELTTLHSFSGADGSRPQAALIEASDGNFYGTTSEGGEFDWGTVFRLVPTGELTTLHSFDGDDGLYPAAALIEASDGNFYGTTKGDDRFGPAEGTIFRFEPSGELTTLHWFSGVDGSYPFGALIEASDGNFYGTTGEFDRGTIFRFDPAGILTTLHSFSGADGSAPRAALIEASDGSLYGTTCYGGDPPSGWSCNSKGGCGTVFKLELSGELTTIHSFNGADGEFPLAALVEASDGRLYGTTSGGGAGLGEVFRLGPVEPTGGLQRPGDCDQNGSITLTDGICVLGFLFRSQPEVLPCGDGASDDPGNLALLDMDQNGSLSLTDGVRLFQYLFTGGDAPPLCPDAACSECVSIAGCPDSSGSCDA